MFRDHSRSHRVQQCFQPSKLFGWDSLVRDDLTDDYTEQGDLTGCHNWKLLLQSSRLGSHRIACNQGANRAIACVIAWTVEYTAPGFTLTCSFNSVLPECTNFVPYSDAAMVFNFNENWISNSLVSWKNENKIFLAKYETANEHKFVICWKQSCIVSNYS